jgi:hypothetical protein
MKECSPPLITREMQIKTTITYHFTLVKMVSIKKTGQKHGSEIESLPPNHEALSSNTNTTKKELLKIQKIKCW